MKAFLKEQRAYRKGEETVTLNKLGVSQADVLGLGLSHQQEVRPGNRMGRSIGKTCLAAAEG